MMILKGFAFRRWNSDGAFRGEIEFLNDAGEIKLNLTETEIQEIAKVCTAAMIRVSQEAFQRIGKAIEATAGPALPAPEST